MTPTKTEERFQGFIECEPNSGCWIWVGATYNKGKYGEYGQFWNHGKHGYAHRFSYECFIGSIPAGHVIDHKCRNKKCVNPTHLRSVTQRINALENSDCPTALNAQKTHCGSGHEFTKRNTYLYAPANQRKCRECRKMRARNYRLTCEVQAASQPSVWCRSKV